MSLTGCCANPAGRGSARRCRHHPQEGGHEATERGGGFSSHSAGAKVPQGRQQAGWVCCQPPQHDGFEAPPASPVLVAVSHLSTVTRMLRLKPVWGHGLRPG